MSEDHQSQKLLDSPSSLDKTAQQTRLDVMITVLRCTLNLHKWCFVFNCLYKFIVQSAGSDSSFSYLCNISSFCCINALILAIDTMF